MGQPGMRAASFPQHHGWSAAFISILARRLKRLVTVDMSA